MTIKSELLELNESLKSRGLNLEAEAVVAAAADVTAYPKLHAALEWNNEKAAHDWRKLQAHQLIIRCRLTIKDGEQQGLSITKPVRMFNHVRDESGYQSTVDTVNDPHRHRRLLKQLHDDIERMNTRLDALASIRGVESVPEEHRQSISAFDKWVRDRLGPDSDIAVAG